MIVPPASAPSMMHASTRADRWKEKSATRVRRTSGTIKNSVASANPHKNPAHKTQGRAINSGVCGALTKGLGISAVCPHAEIDHAGDCTDQEDDYSQPPGVSRGDIELLVDPEK